MQADVTREPTTHVRHNVLLCQVGSLVCGLPLAHIVETLRPLELAFFEGMPPFVSGLSIIRGAPIPVVDLGRLLGSVGDATRARWVLARADGHQVALAVERVIGVRTLAAPSLSALPPLLGEASAEVVSRVGSLDTRLLIMLESGRVLPQSTWASLQIGGGGSVTLALSAADIERFRAAIAVRLGIWFEDQKFEYLAGILEQRLETTADVPARYLNALEKVASGQAELREIARELTVGETYFLRHTDQFRAFSEVALPSRLAARGITKQLRLLSAGCSSGEEAYTLSILTREGLSESGWEVSIDGVDVNPNAVERARGARYSQWALRETPARVAQQYFVAEGREFVLSKAVQSGVRFEEGNLVADDSWAPESYDVIFCRNVLMYFTPENARRVVQRLSRALAPGGFLFLGHAENLRGLSPDFELRHTHGTFYYQRRDRASPLRTEFHATELPQPATPRSALALDWASTWLETVQRSSERIRVLTDATAAQEREQPTIAPLAPRLDLSLALELLSHERFTEALEVLTKMPATSAQDADAVLLRAALLTHCGRLEAAASACAELLSLDGLSCGAHYLLALCQERQADVRSAIEHAQIASYLDPSFAMPHLHLGLMARRMGERDTARRELTQAALLLQREEPARLLLFGGGFSREGLATLCHSELSRLGATE